MYQPLLSTRLFIQLVVHLHRVLREYLVECCFTSTETVGLLGTGAQDGHFDFHTAPELWRVPILDCLFLQPIVLLHRV